MNALQLILEKYDVLKFNTKALQLLIEKKL